MNSNWCHWVGKEIATTQGNLLEQRMISSQMALVSPTWAKMWISLFLYQAITRLRWLLQCGEHNLSWGSLYRLELWSLWRSWGGRLGSDNIRGIHPLLAISTLPLFHITENGNGGGEHILKVFQLKSPSCLQLSTYSKSSNFTSSHSSSRPL